MAIFRIDKKKLSRCSIKEDGFGDEFALRDFFADNLEELLGIRFIEKEYPISEGRIDTLGLDENNSPVIIEYKWKENEEVLAQGLFYYNWLKNNKKHFELLVENKLGEKNKVNWEQARIVLIAQGFGRYIQGAVQQEKNIELITYHHYQPNILQLERVSKEKKKVNRKTGIKDSTRYDLDYHLQKTDIKIKKKFQTLREKILQLSDVEEKSEQKSGITYRTTKSFVRFEFRPTWIQVLLRESSYSSDSKKLVRDVTSHEWGYKGLVKFTADSDIEYLFDLIEDSYESTL